MSTVLAIAGVTAILQDMLANRMTEEPVATAVGVVDVSALPPDRVDLGEASDPTQVNIFLHQVSRNPGWANIGRPTHDPRGGRISAPPLPLDLHYLITAYAGQALHAEILLAQIAQLFHETPVPPREVIVQALDPAAPPQGFPAALAQSGLAEQIEHLRITPEALSNEEISKLWAALQARYRPTLAFRVTTVLIDSDLAQRRPLPVGRPATRAASMSRPMIETVQAAAGRFAPIGPGSAITITGRGLQAPQMRLVAGGTDLTAAITEASAGSIALTLPDPGSLRAGAHALTIRHLDAVGEPPELRETAVSNPGILVLQPQASGVFAVSDSVVEDGVSYRDGTLSLTLTPPAGRGQLVTALLNATDGSGRSYGFRAEPGNGLPPESPETSTVAIRLRHVAAGDYLLRAQVDAGESPLDQAADGTFTGPQVTI